MSVASCATFAPGERLMREGEPADYVIVILAGQTRICVDENGWERVLAERGPGQLVGERGGLQVRARSASVVAVEQVRGLVVTTRDFSAFISRNLRVLDIVESQLYDRLIEYQAGYPDGRGPGGLSVISADSGPVTAWPNDRRAARHARPRLFIGQNCTVLLTDVVGFGSQARNDDDRLIIREALLDMTRMMLRGMPDVRSEDRGDGLLSVIPPAVPTAVVIDRLEKELLSALSRHNSTRYEPARFRLRAAINVGPVVSDTMGVSGESIIMAARLVELPLFKKAMSTSRASLGVIASRFIYETVISHGREPAGYCRVQAAIKETRTPAWMKLIDTVVTSHSEADSAVA